MYGYLLWYSGRRYVHALPKCNCSSLNFLHVVAISNHFGRSDATSDETARDVARGSLTSTTKGTTMGHKKKKKKVRRACVLLLLFSTAHITRLTVHDPRIGTPIQIAIHVVPPGYIVCIWLFLSRCFHHCMESKAEFSA